MLRAVIRSALLAPLLLCISAQDDGPRDPLCRAAQNGDLAQVRTLLAGGANPNVHDEHGVTALMFAAAERPSLADADKEIQRSPLGVATLLLDKGAAVNAQNEAGQTALLLAINGSASEYRVIGADDAMVRLLVSRGADVNAHDKEGWTPLLKLLNQWADQPALLQFLLARKADVTARLADGRTSLMIAARLGKDARLAPLIAAGADPNARDATGATALMIAATVQWEDAALSMLKLLPANGANLNIADNQGRTAADRAAEAGYFDRARFLVDNGAKLADAGAFWKKARNFALLHAISSGTPDAARAMLQQGADPDFLDPNGRTPLLAAADQEYSAEKATLLLDHHASPNLPGANGDTPLMVAVDRYQSDIVKALLDHGADPKAVDRDGNSVLMRAAASKNAWQEERKPLVHLLLEKGADPAHRGPHGVTVLMLMAGNGNPALALLLEKPLEKPLEIDARDDDGNTALLYAARYFVRGWQRRNGWALLGKGADVNAANHNGETALILAATQFEADAARLLLQKNANVNAKTNTGRTALMQAIDGPKEFDNDRHVVYSPQIASLLIAAGADVSARDSAGHTALALARQRGYDDIAAALIRAGAKD
jgi:uncharacterized protein